MEHTALDVHPLLNLCEVAQLLSVSKKTLYYWVSRNEVPYLKIGRHLRFDYRAVIDFFEDRTRATRKRYVESLTGIGPSGISGSLKTRKARSRGFASETE
jgi:excisionase family DNA binding protein